MSQKNIILSFIWSDFGYKSAQCQCEGWQFVSVISGIFKECPKKIFLPDLNIVVFLSNLLVSAWLHDFSILLDSLATFFFVILAFVVIEALDKWNTLRLFVVVITGFSHFRANIRQKFN